MLACKFGHPTLLRSHRDRWRVFTANSSMLSRSAHIVPEIGQERVSDAEKAAESAVNGTPRQKAQAQQEILGTGAR